MPKNDQDFLPHVQNRTVKPPQYLYKYTTMETAQAILESGSLRFQSPLQYNDPYDAQWDPFWPISTPEARRQERLLVENALANPSTWPQNGDHQLMRLLELECHRIRNAPKNLQAFEIKKFALDVSASQMPDSVKEKILDFRRRLRLLCLSEACNSMLMWSHYADHHRGVLLRFNTHLLEYGLKRPLKCVQYCKKLPRTIDPAAWSMAKVFGTPEPDFPGHEQEWALSKHVDWSYEREWRFVSVASRGTEGLFEDFPYPTRSLCKIVFGCRSDPALKVQIAKIVNSKYANAQICEMSMHPFQFALEENPLSSSSSSAEGS